MVDALTLLTTRKSIPAQFLAEPAPSPSEMAQIFTIASRVPDHGKLAPWRFIVFSGEARAAAGEKLADFLKARQPDVTEARLAEERGRFIRAPLVIGVVSTAAEHVKIPVWEQQLSAGASTVLLQLAAHALGYATVWLTEWMAFDPEAASLFGVKPEEKVVGFVHIGTPTMPPQERPRPVLSDIVSHWSP